MNKRPASVLAAATLLAALLALSFGAAPPLTSAAASLDLAAGIVAALPANAASTNQDVAINSVSCPSAGNCSAVGSYTDSVGSTDGLLLTETGGKWAVGVEAVLPPNTLTGDVVLESVSCPSAGNCTAVGRYGGNSGTSQGLLLRETNGTWAPGLEAVLPANARSSSQSVDLTSVSCSSVGNCGAVGSYVDSSSSFEGLLLNETAGTWAAGAEVSLPANNRGTGNAFLNAVSCASAGNCTAVGYYEAPSPVNSLSRGLLVSETAGSWSAGVEAPLPANASTQNTTSDLDSVSCASPGNCTAVGTYSDSSAALQGLLLTETAGSWATGVEASLPGNAAPGGLGSSLVFYGGNALPLGSVSCASPGNCTAVGSYPDSSGNVQGLLLTETGGTWAAGVEAALPAGAATAPQGVNVASVSCASAGNCVAVGSYGVSTGGGAPLLLTESAGSWATGVEPSVPASAFDATVDVSAVSCASADSCSAVGSYWGNSSGALGLVIGGAPPLVTLTLSRGKGTGAVSSSPAGISCGTACSHAYPSGTPITLTAATPAVGSIFAGWSGCLAIDTTACAIAIDRDTTVTATFDLAPNRKSKPKPCVVPKVKGKTLSGAAWLVETNACAVGSVRRLVSSEIQKAHVTSQSPRAGARLKHGAMVDLVVAASKPFHCRVPEIVGLSVRAAEKRIRLRDCRVGEIRRRTSTLLRQNHVLEQSPARRRTKPAGSRVVLVVGKGPRTGKLPSLGSIAPRRLPPFIAYDPPAGGIWLMKPDGSAAHRVGPPDGAGPVWSPDATQILYTAAAPQNDAFISRDLYAMNADGTGRHSIMPSAGGFFHGAWGDDDFHWSPSGKQLLFVQGAYMSESVQIADADGSDAHAVPNLPWAGEASFSPDGNYIVLVGAGSRFTPPEAKPRGIYVIKPDGTGLRQLTFGGDVEEPSWSPDGTRIVYGCLVDDGGKAHAICELSGDPARQRILYRHANQTFLDPIWNADGTKIVVTVEKPQRPGGVALLSPSGGPPVLIAALSLDGSGSWNADW